MRRSLGLVGWMLALMAVTAWGQQSVFEVGPGAQTGTFTFVDGSQFSVDGLHLSPTSTVTAPDTSLWGPSGILFPVTGTYTFPDRSILNSAGLAMSATSTLRGPDSSIWNSGGVTMAAGKQVSLANGSSAAPALSFSSQATAGLYREAADDLRLVLSGSIPALRAYKANASSGVTSVPLGASTGFAVIGGRVCTSTASAPTTGTTAEILASCPLPANALSIDGAGVKVKAWGTTAANGNNKTLRIDVGGSTCATLTAATNNGVLTVETTILRTGAATQECGGSGIASSGTVSATRAAPTEDTTLSMTVSAKGTTPTASGDLTLRGMTVELIN